MIVAHLIIIIFLYKMKTFYDDLKKKNVLIFHRQNALFFSFMKCITV